MSLCLSRPFSLSDSCQLELVTKQNTKREWKNKWDRLRRQTERNRKRGTLIQNSTCYSVCSHWREKTLSVNTCTWMANPHIACIECTLLTAWYGVTALTLQSPYGWEIFSDSKSCYCHTYLYMDIYMYTVYRYTHPHLQMQWLDKYTFVFHIFISISVQYLFVYYY